MAAGTTGRRRRRPGGPASVAAGPALAHPHRGAQDRHHPPAGDAGGDPRPTWSGRGSTPSRSPLLRQRPRADADRSGGRSPGCRSSAAVACAPRSRRRWRRSRRARGRGPLRGEDPRGAEHDVRGAALSAGRATWAGSRASPAGRRSLFLSIRSFDTHPLGLCPEAEACAAARAAASRRSGAAAGRGRRAGSTSSSRIRAAAPGVPSAVWRQEDYRANARAIMEALCGRAARAPAGDLRSRPGPARPRRGDRARRGAAGGISRSPSGGRGSARSSPPPSPAPTGSGRSPRRSGSGCAPSTRRTSSASRAPVPTC